MANETIALATNYDESKFKSGMLVSQKLDGIPVKITVDKHGIVHHCTRQGNQLQSIEHILQAASSHLPYEIPFIGELYIPDVPFKDIGGKVRAFDPAPELNIYFYDALLYAPYCDRVEFMHGALAPVSEYTPLKSVYSKPNGLDKWNCTANTVDDARKAIAWADSTWDNGAHGIEGLVFRNPDMYPTDAGKRCKGFLRYKPQPTIDLRVKMFEEAVSKEKVPLGMIGAVFVEYRGELKKVGAGKLSHAERKAIFDNPDAYLDKICEIQYMPDPTYNGFRQGTFQRWRPDKDTPDA